MHEMRLHEKGIIQYVALRNDCNAGLIGRQWRRFALLLCALKLRKARPFDVVSRLVRLVRLGRIRSGGDIGALG